MVTFRYHLTSLAACFVALALGIVVGTTSLSAEPAAKPAATPTAVVEDHSEELAASVQSRLVRGALPDQRVLVLLAPDAPAAAARSLVSALKAAGSTVTGQVQLLPALLDASATTTVDGVVSATAPTTVSLPAEGSVQRAGALLAAALVTSDQGTDLSGAAQQKVIGGFTGGQLIAGDAPTVKATLVLVLAGPARGATLASLSAGFQSRVGTVVAATPAAAEGRGVVAVLRGGSTQVSDVDLLGSSTGLLAAVLALGEQASGGSGHYGTGPKAEGIVPETG